MRPLRAGFTLLEVLVALAVLAIALGAALRLATQTTAGAAAMRDRTVASWVAENRLHRVLLGEEPLALGRYSGEERQAGRDWRWRLTVTSTRDGDVRRLEVQVLDDDDSLLATLVGFQGRR